MSKVLHMLRALATGALFAIGTAALAAPITYTITGTGTGTVGATPFTNAAYTITVSADTTQIVGAGIFTVPSIVTTITIAGLGTMTVTEPVGMFNNQGATAAGFQRPGSDLLDFVNPAFATWNLGTPLGPLTNMPAQALNQFTNLATTLGAMTMPTSSNVTFVAGGGAAPAGIVAVPATATSALAVLAAGLAVLGAASLRRRRR